MQVPAAIGVKIVGPFPFLTGATGDCLGNLIVNKLPTGSVAWVAEQASFYYLDRESTAAVSAPAVIATGRGASEPGRWFRFDGGASFFTGTATLTAQNVPSDAGVTVSGAVPGAVVGDFVVVKSQARPDLGDLTLIPGIVTAPDTVEFILQNRTAGDLDVLETVFQILVIRPG